MHVLEGVAAGGINTGNVEEYLACPSIIACGGTWMVKPALFADGDFGQVEQIAREAMDVVRKARPAKQPLCLGRGLAPRPIFCENAPRACRFHRTKVINCAD